MIATPKRARHLAHWLIIHMNKNEIISPVKIIMIFVFQVLIILSKTSPVSLS